MGIALALAALGFSIVVWPEFFKEAVAGATALLTGLVAWGWRTFNSKISELYERQHHNTHAIEHEQARNTVIEAKADRAAVHAEAVRIQVAENRSEIELLKIMVEERSEDKAIIVALRAEGKELRAEIKELKKHDFT